MRFHLTIVVIMAIATTTVLKAAVAICCNDTVRGVTKDYVSSLVNPEMICGNCCLGEKGLYFFHWKIHF